MTTPLTSSGSMDEYGRTPDTSNNQTTNPEACARAVYDRLRVITPPVPEDPSNGPANSR